MGVHCQERSFPLPAAYRAPEADEKEAAAAAAVEAAEGGEKKNKVEGMEVEEGGEAAEVEAAEGGEIKNEAEEVGEGQAEEGGEKGKSPVEGGKPPNGEEPSKVMLDDQDLLDELKVIRVSLSTPGQIPLCIDSAAPPWLVLFLYDSHHLIRSLQIPWPPSSRIQP